MDIDGMDSRDPSTFSSVPAPPLHPRFVCDPAVRSAAALQDVGCHTIGSQT